MADIIADVIRLFITEGTFLSGSKQGQAGFATDTKRWLLHNLSDDTLVFGVSDDSLQLLIEGAQDVSGVKAFIPGIKIGTSSSFVGGFIFYDLGTKELLIENQDVGDMRLECASGDLILNNGLEVKNNLVELINNSVLQVIPSDSNRAGLNLPQGTSPNVPDNGDVWTTGAGIFVRINGVTLQLLGAGDVVLLTTDQSVNGVKTFIDGLKVSDPNIQEGSTLTHDSTGTILRNDSAIDDTAITLDATSGDLIFKGGAELMRISSPLGSVEIKNGLKLITVSSSLSTNPLIIPHGTMPSTPDNGGIWTTIEGLYARINGQTQGIGALKTFVATLTGVTGAPTVQAEYQIIGKFVHLFIPILQGTSNATTCTITGLPSEARPDARNTTSINIIDNNLAKVGGSISVQNSSSMTLSLGASDAGWTNSGNKGLSWDISLVYRIA